LPEGFQNPTPREGRVVVIMGPPNAGKDTQGELLSERVRGKYIGSGELIRSEASPRLMAIMARGDLVPEEDFRRLISHAIAEVPLDTPVILVGIAKRPEEARWLVEHLPTLGRWLDRVVLLMVSQHVAIERSGRRGAGRADDHPDVQAVRWARFFEKTQQSLDYFRELGYLSEVDAVGDVHDVADRIDQTLLSK
jgi:adenylate kinase